MCRVGIIRYSAYIKKSNTFSIHFDGIKEMSDKELEKYLQDWIYNINVKVYKIINIMLLKYF